jgi:hypothetical protein
VKKDLVALFLKPFNGDFVVYPSHDDLSVTGIFSFMDSNVIAINNADFFSCYRPGLRAESRRPV